MNPEQSRSPVSPAMDDVLKRMLNTPPDPKKKTEPAAPSEKKPAK